MSNKDTRFDSAKAEMTRALSLNASAYLRIGLTEFYRIKKTQFNHAAASAIGNLSIGIELLIKTLICSHNPALLFTNMPAEVKMLCMSPSLSSKIADSINLHDLKAFVYKTMEFDECTGMFYCVYPEEEQNFKPYLKLLAKIRNQSIHSAIPSFQFYELERVAYLAIWLAEHLNTTNKTVKSYSLTEVDRKYLNAYDAKRVQQVHQKIQQAKSKARSIDPDRLGYDCDSWEEHLIECPVCESKAVLDGNTEHAVTQDGENEFSEYLEFYALSFVCGECGLKLNDPEELRLANIDLVYDRSEDLHKWHRDYP